MKKFRTLSSCFCYEECASTIKKLWSKYKAKERNGATCGITVAETEFLKHFIAENNQDDKEQVEESKGRNMNEHACHSLLTECRNVPPSTKTKNWFFHPDKYYSERIPANDIFTWA